MANAAVQVGDKSVLLEEMTTTNQREVSTSGGSAGGLGSAADASPLIAGSSSCPPHGSNSGSSVQKIAASGIGLGSTQRAFDATKRKKLKSRNAEASPSISKAEATVVSPGQNHSSKANRSDPSYSKDHLDAWLENCLRDASNAQLSSSSEFLDFIPPTAATHKQMFMSQHQQQQQQLKQQPQHQKQQEFLKRSQPYGMVPGTPFSLGIQRHSHSLSHRYPMLFPPQNLNGYGMGYGGDGGQEFASLPPLVNMMGGAGGTGSEHEPNSTDVLDGSGSNPNFSRGFRFSDPCLLNPSDNDSKLSGQNTPECRNGNNNGSGCELAQQNKFFAALMEQINILHDTNSKICRNLHETKGAYTPGMMTDVVREVKEAARVREDALLSRVKSMVEERQWSLNEGNVRILRDIDELKSHVMQLRLEKKETNKRLSHLEAENKYLRQALAGCINQRQSYHDIIYENDRARGSRKPFPNGGGGGLVGSGALGVRRAQSFNLHYGTMHQTPHQATHSLEEDDEIEEEFLEQAGLDGDEQSMSANKRLSCSSSESRGNGVQTPSTSTQHSLAAKTAQQAARSPPVFALVSDNTNPGLPPPLLPRKKEHAQLKRELSDAAAARKEANQRIIALEKLVKDLSAQVTSQPNWNPVLTGTTPDAALATKYSVADGPITDL
ncbi:uncharacterized protein LOC108098570 isoform X6 [Drosophila ficusphila]|uniref:uncharacterized protein LOC108098570 isoform X6 n=1 Tax=Drosophila ficusphila TaxID=30025 RepID=UPI0007E7BC33|nr:uncharacterized protein LOC108098570 isoform X6 [Drosophila ficusphila]